MNKTIKKWHLQELVSQNSGIVIADKYKNLVIEGLALDSRRVEKGFLFAAFKGAASDGAEYADAAIKAGAVAILCDSSTQVKFPDYICVIKHDNPRFVFSKIVAKFYGEQPQVIAAVTGTNGKTSTVHFCREIWKRLGKHAASIGTVGIEDSEGKFDYDRSNFLTTPDPVKLHDIIHKLEQKGVTHLAMEASSHGLDQYRLDGVNVKIGAFSNLTRDHLDYHGTFENYLAAKMRLFTSVMEDGSVAVLNSDIPEYKQLLAECNKHKHRIISYGKYDNSKEKNYIDILKISPTHEGQQVAFEINNKVYDINTPLIGEFQAYNLLCALGMVIASGANVDEAVSVLSDVPCVPGRMQKVEDNGKSLPVFVDYSHTPDALEKALAVLKEHNTHGRLLVVFGCGGDRDKGKRPLMGEVAARLADIAIVTDDNPRSEVPDTIRKEVLAGIKNSNVLEIGDRRMAIKKAIEEMQKGDMLLIAGKGHEKTQIIGAETLPFDDVLVAEEEIKNKKGA